MEVSRLPRLSLGLVGCHNLVVGAEIISTCTIIKKLLCKVMKCKNCLPVNNSYLPDNYFVGS